MINLDIHRVQRVELVTLWPANDNMATIRIVSDDAPNDGVVITLYGQTDALHVLPRAADFNHYTTLPSHRRAA